MSSYAFMGNSAFSISLSVVNFTRFSSANFTTCWCWNESLVTCISICVLLQLVSSAKPKLNENKISTVHG